MSENWWRKALYKWIKAGIIIYVDRQSAPLTLAIDLFVLPSWVNHPIIMTTKIKFIQQQALILI